MKGTQLGPVERAVIYDRTTGRPKVLAVFVSHEAAFLYGLEMRLEKVHVASAAGCGARGPGRAACTLAPGHSAPFHEEAYWAVPGNRKVRIWKS